MLAKRGRMGAHVEYDVDGFTCKASDHFDMLGRSFLEMHSTNGILAGYTQKTFWKVARKSGGGKCGAMMQLQEASSVIALPKGIKQAKTRNFGFFNSHVRDSPGVDTDQRTQECKLPYSAVDPPPAPDRHQSRNLGS